MNCDPDRGVRHGRSGGGHGVGGRLRRERVGQHDIGCRHADGRSDREMRARQQADAVQGARQGGTGGLRILDRDVIPVRRRDIAAGVLKPVRQDHEISHVGGAGRGRERLEGNDFERRAAGVGRRRNPRAVVGAVRQRAAEPDGRFRRVVDVDLEKDHGRGRDRRRVDGRREPHGRARHRREPVERVQRRGVREERRHRRIQRPVGRAGKIEIRREGQYAGQRRKAGMELADARRTAGIAVTRRRIGRPDFIGARARTSREHEASGEECDGNAVAHVGGSGNLKSAGAYHRASLRDVRCKK